MKRASLGSSPLNHAKALRLALDDAITGAKRARKMASAGNCNVGWAALCAAERNLGKAIAHVGSLGKRVPQLILRAKKEVESTKEQLQKSCSFKKSASVIVSD